MFAVIMSFLTAIFVFTLSKKSIKYGLTTITLLFSLPIWTYAIYGMGLALEQVGAAQLLSDIGMIIISAYIEPFNAIINRGGSIPFTIFGIPVILGTLVSAIQLWNHLSTTAPQTQG